MSKVVSEKVYENAILQNADGMIVANLPQQDMLGIRKCYDDGTVEWWVKPYEGGSARLIIPRYDPQTQQPRCRHCGEEL